MITKAVKLLHIMQGTVIQIEKVLINDRLRVLKAS